MHTEAADSITIINKNYPPNPGITGESANELAAYLIQQGIKVNVVSTDAVYGTASLKTKPAGDIIKVKSIYNGKNKAIRLLASFAESYLLVKTALRKTTGPIIAMTDPPFMIFWSSVLIKKRRWMYWAMDLYPEAFVAAGLTGSNNFLYRWFKRKVYKNPPAYILSLGQLQLDYLLKDYKIHIAGTSLPCGIWSRKEKSDQLPSWKTDTDRLYFGYCGNLGEAHSFEFVSEVIRQLDPQKHCFILAVYGSKADKLLEFARQFPVVKIVPGVSKNELHLIDIHLVTLKNEWNHICVPSKAVTAICTGASILFCGTEDNDNWYYLKEAGWFIDETKDLQIQVTAFLSQLSRESIDDKKKSAILIAENLHALKIKSFNEVVHFSRQQHPIP